MDLSKIVSISGHGGLFEVLSQMKNGIIVQELGETKKMPVHASQKVVALDDISIYTAEEDLPLKDVLLKILEKQKGKELGVNAKSSPDELKDYLASVLPDYDKDRVYVSDIKKLVKWYSILDEHKLIKADEPEAKKEAKEENGKKEAKPKKAAAKPKAKKAAAGPKPKTSAPKKTTKTKSAQRKG